jgi:hypothetical protein
LNLFYFLNSIVNYIIIVKKRVNYIIQILLFITIYKNIQLFVVRDYFNKVYFLCLKGRATVQNIIYASKLIFHPVYTIAVELKKRYFSLISIIFYRNL